MTKFEQHERLIQQLHETYVKKNMAYGDSFSLSIKKYGMVAALTRMSDKWNRLETLMMGGKNDVSDESIKDTLLDLANYALMTYMEME